MGMAQELLEAPQALSRQQRELAAPLAELTASLIRRPPQLVITCARGSSANAARFVKHLIELYLGIPVAAAAPNIASVYHQQLRLKDQLFLAISQSGKSEDLVESAAMARDAGALTASLVNTPESPLAAACDVVLPMGAGPELSIAATKSFVASLAALLRLTALWAADGRLRSAVDRLPERVGAAGELDWSAALDVLAPAASLIAIGRGPTLAIASEAALKLKEVANLHAEAFSGAEFRHGPMALVSANYPIFVLMPSDAAEAGMRRLVLDIGGKGAALIVTGPGGSLPVVAPDHPATDAVCLIQGFYAMLVRLAARLGIDPNRPRHLQKVTRTR
jgi:glucosamine--fructose-6-phosphate aminotransferase (isomerizing)